MAEELAQLSLEWVRFLSSIFLAVRRRVPLEQWFENDQLEEMAVALSQDIKAVHAFAALAHEDRTLVANIVYPVVLEGIKGLDIPEDVKGFFLDFVELI